MLHKRIEKFISGKYEKSFDFSLAWGVLYFDEGAPEGDPVALDAYRSSVPLFSDGASCTTIRPDVGYF